MGFLGVDYIPRSVLSRLSAEDRERLEADEHDDDPLAPRFELLRATILQNLRTYTATELRDLVEWFVGFVFTNGPLLDALESRERQAVAKRRKGTHNRAQKARDEIAPIVCEIDALKAEKRCSVRAAILRWLSQAPQGRVAPRHPCRTGPCVPGRDTIRG